MAIDRKRRAAWWAAAVYHASQGSSYDPDAQAYIMAAGVTDATYKDAINQFILDLKAASIWTKFDRLWLFANQDATAALMDIKALENATPVNAPAFTAGRGYAGNGSTSYLNTNFVPSTHGVNYTLNSALMAAEVVSVGAIQGSAIMGMSINGVATTQIFPRFSDGNAYGDVNSNSAGDMAAVNANADGALFMVQRTASNAAALYRNNVLLDDTAAASTSLPAVAIFVLGRNSNGTLGFPSSSSRQCAMAAFASSFNSTERAAFQAARDALKTAIGW